MSKPLKMDNGHGIEIPVDLDVGLLVEQHLYFGQFPIIRLSGFHDAIADDIITNAFTVGLFSLKEVTSRWRRLASMSEAPVKPVLILTGLYGWSEDEQPPRKGVLANFRCYTRASRSRVGVCAHAY